MRIFSKFSLFAGLCLVGGVANATCDSTLSFYQTAVSSNNFVLAGQLISETPECFGGSQVAAQVQINGTSFQQAAEHHVALAVDGEALI